MARVRQVPLGVYVPGESIIHRASAGLKCLLMIVVFITSSFFITSWPVGVAAVVVSSTGYVIAHIPARVAWGQVWPALPFLAVIGGFLAWQSGWQVAVLRLSVILMAIVCATLVTLTTTVAEMMAMLDSLLEPLTARGFPGPLISLALALTIRLIPLQFATVYEVLDARHARGAGRSFAAFGTPVVIRSVRRAERIADALIARGAIDTYSPDDTRTPN